MATVLTHEAMQRLDALLQERTTRLARKADHFEVSPDTVHPGAWIVRNPRVPYRIEIVDQEGRCSCSHYRMWDRCKHSALVATRKGGAR